MKLYPYIYYYLFIFSEIYIHVGAGAAGGKSAAAAHGDKPRCLDLTRPPYVLYGVKYIDLGSLQPRCLVDTDCAATNYCSVENVCEGCVLPSEGIRSACAVYDDHPFGTSKLFPHNIPCFRTTFPFIRGSIASHVCSSIQIS